MATHSMLHSIASERWTLTRVEWTSSCVRNQDLTRIMITFHFQASYGYEFSSMMSERLAVSPNIPINPSDRSIQAEIESQATRKRSSSPAVTVVPSKKRRGTQTVVQGSHLEQIERE